jgi:ligand-binding SRPBCC domain-containing protein
MYKVHYLKSIQKLPVSLEEVWEFFSNANNLLTITPPFLNLVVTNEVFGEEVYPGQIISHKGKPIAGIAVSWVTEITHLEKMKFFVDEQRKGPYKLWHHQHHFKAIEGGSEMTDLVHYAIPFGIASEAFHSIVKKKLREIFDYRFNKINELFGCWPNQQCNLEVE